MNKKDNDVHPYNDLPENANEDAIKEARKKYSLRRYLPDDSIKNLVETYGDNSFPGIIKYIYKSSITLDAMSISDLMFFIL